MKVKVHETPLTRTLHLSLRMSASHTCPCRQLVSLQGFSLNTEWHSPPLPPSLPISPCARYGESDDDVLAQLLLLSHAPSPTCWKNPGCVATGAQVHELSYPAAETHFKNHSQIFATCGHQHTQVMSEVTEDLL